MMFRNSSPVNLTQNNNMDSSSTSGNRMRRSNSRGFDKMKPLAPGFIPGDDDVLVGRGKKCLVHTGNIRFKQIVATRLSAYLAAECRVDKTAILMEVIAQVRINSPNGGFVKQNPQTGQYFEVGDFLAKEKTAQAFRDALHEYYSSSNPSKKKRRIQSTISAEKKLAVGSSSSSSINRSTSPVAEEDDESSEVTFVGTTTSQSTPAQPSLVSAMHTQFTRQSSSNGASSSSTPFPTTLRKAKSAPASPVRDEAFEVDLQRSQTPPPSFARFVSADPVQDADAPLPLDFGSMDMMMMNMNMSSSPEKRRSSLVLGETFALLSSALSEVDTGFGPEPIMSNVNNLNMPLSMENNMNNNNNNNVTVNEDPFEPIPLSSLPVFENMVFSDLA